MNGEYSDSLKREFSDTIKRRLVFVHTPYSNLAHATRGENLQCPLKAECAAIAIATDPYTNFATGSVRARAMMPMDIAVRHPESFVVSTVS